jgi:glutaredoxin
MSTEASVVRVLGTSWCPDCTRSKDFLSTHHVDFEWTDIEVDADAAREVESLHHGKRVVPTILFVDGSVLTEPSNDELATKLGIVV